MTPWPMQMKTKMKMNIKLSKMPLKMFFSSRIRLELMKLKIYRHTNMLNTTVKCLLDPILLEYLDHPSEPSQFVRMPE